MALTNSKQQADYKVAKNYHKGEEEQG